MCFTLEVAFCSSKSRLGSTCLTAKINSLFTKQYCIAVKSLCTRANTSDQTKTAKSDKTAKKVEEWAIMLRYKRTRGNIVLQNYMSTSVMLLL